MLHHVAIGVRLHRGAGQVVWLVILENICLGLVERRHQPVARIDVIKNLPLFFLVIVANPHLQAVRAGLFPQTRTVRRVAEERRRAVGVDDAVKPVVHVVIQPLPATEHHVPVLIVGKPHADGVIGISKRSAGIRQRSDPVQIVIHNFPKSSRRGAGIGSVGDVGDIPNGIVFVGQALNVCSF